MPQPSGADASAQIGQLYAVMLSNQPVSSMRLLDLVSCAQLTTAAAGQRREPNSHGAACNLQLWQTTVF